MLRPMDMQCPVQRRQSISIMTNEILRALELPGMEDSRSFEQSEASVPMGRTGPLFSSWGPFPLSLVLKKPSPPSYSLRGKPDTGRADSVFHSTQIC